MNTVTLFQFFRANVLEKAREDENSSVFKVVAQILQQNCSGKLITIQEIFFRLMSEEYFMFSRHFIRIDVNSHVLNKDGSSNPPDYIQAYFGRPKRMAKLSLYEFMKKVFLTLSNNQI